MYKYLFLICFILISGCKDKYERALDAVTETSISVRKCHLKYLANEKPNFPCNKIEHNIAIEKAVTYGISEKRISAAIKIGHIQVNQSSRNLMAKGKAFEITRRYKKNSEDDLDKAQKYKNIYTNFKNGKVFSIADFVEHDYLVPLACVKLDYMIRDRRIVRNEFVPNEDYDAETCIYKLTELINQHEKASKIWDEKSVGWEKSAKKINSEY